MYYIGIDLGGTGAKAGVVTEDGKIIAKSTASTKEVIGYENIVKVMADITYDVMKTANITADDVKSIGIGCPGSIDDKNGVVYYSNNIVMKNAPIADEMKKYLSGMDSKSSPFYYTARITLAQKYLTSGDTAAANKILDDLIADKNTPSTIAATAASLR